MLNDTTGMQTDVQINGLETKNFRLDNYLNNWKLIIQSRKKNHEQGLYKGQLIRRGRVIECTNMKLPINNDFLITNSRNLKLHCIICENIHGRQKCSPKRKLLNPDNKESIKLLNKAKNTKRQSFGEEQRLLKTKPIKKKLETPKVNKAFKQSSDECSTNLNDNPAQNGTLHSFYKEITDDSNTEVVKHLIKTRISLNETFENYISDKYSKDKDTSVTEKDNCTIC